MAFSADEMRQISARYPGIEWVNGMPYTPEQGPAPAGTDPMGNPVDAQGNYVDVGTGSLVPAHTTEGRFPWEFLALQVAAPALVAGAQGAFAGAGGGGGATASTAASTGTGAAAGGAPAAGGGGGMLGFLDKIPGLSKLTDLAGNPLVQMGSKALGQMAGAATQNRQEANDMAMLAARIYDQQQLDRERLSMDKRRDDRDMRGEAYSNAVRAGLMANFTPLDRGQFKTRVPDVSFMKGGFGQGQDAARLMEQQALLQLMSEPDTSVPPAEKFEPKGASFWEKIAGPLALGGTILSAPRAPGPQPGPSAANTPMGVMKGVRF